MSDDDAFVPLRLETQRLVLRELVEDDAPAANEYERDPEVVKYVTHGVRTLEESRAYLRENERSKRERPRKVFDLAMTTKADGGRTFLGRAGMKVTDAALREAMLWYVLAPRHQGHGYATEAVRELMRFAFEVLGMHRLYLDIDPRNRASARVGERIGMRREAHFVENVLLKGEWVDTWIYAMLDREWRERGK